MAAASSQTPYFDRPLPQALIFGSFFVIFVPLCALSVVPNFVAALPYLLLLELVGLGVTHFFITLALYGQSRNLEHFASTTQRRLIYFVAPALVLLLFAFRAAADLDRTAPLFALYFFGALRFFDFFHVGRQSFGMLQIFKRPVAGALPEWSRRAENAFFVGMALLQWVSFAMGGRFQGDVLYARLPALALGALFVTIAASYLQLPAGARRGGIRPLAYFVMQALSAAAAVYDTRLYGVALAMHYVEYHVIMAPRCLRAPLDDSKRVDRVYRPLRDHALLFYALLIGVVLTFEARNLAGDDLSASTRFFVHIFDGIFFVHYLIEAFLWKFKEPFYAQTLTPLYFGSASHAGSGSGDDALPRPQRSGWRSWAVAAALLGALGVSGALGSGLSTIEQRVVAPLDADNHVRWGMRLVERGELAEARRHGEHALARVADHAAARALLESVTAREASNARGSRHHQAPTRP